MKQEKAKAKLNGSVAAYLAHKGIENSVPPCVTFAGLRDLMEACEVFALESPEAERAALERLAILEASAPIYEPMNPLEERAAALLTVEEAAAVRGYAKKRGMGYVRHIIHVITHPRGKSPETLAEAELKSVEAQIALQPERIADVRQVRARALCRAAAQLARA